MEKTPIDTMDETPNELMDGKVDGNANVHKYKYKACGLWFCVCGKKWG